MKGEVANGNIVAQHGMCHFGDPDVRTCGSHEVGEFAGESYKI